MVGRQDRDDIYNISGGNTRDIKYQDIEDKNDNYNYNNDENYRYGDGKEGYGHIDEDKIRNDG